MKKLNIILCAASSVLLAFTAAPGQAGSDNGVGDRRLSPGFGPQTRSDLVSILKNGVLEQVDFGDLRREFPSQSSSALDEVSLRANAIVGWYDSGHNYHPEKMNARTPGTEVMNPATRKGKGLRGGEPQSKAIEQGGNQFNAAKFGRRTMDPGALGAAQNAKNVQEGGQ